MVTSQKMIEREMDYRGSKSNLKSNRPTISPLDFIFVKEQRVDGSYFPFFRKLRYTLMGFERSYQEIVLSNQTRLYSSNSNTINPFFITGFADAESSFNIIVQPKLDTKAKWRVKAMFAIKLDLKDKTIIENIQSWFGIGKVYVSGDKVYYRVESFKDLDIIINHFDNYPLVTAKVIDYQLFKNCLDIIKKNEHLTEKGILKILEYKSILNKGLSSRLINNFSNINVLNRPDFIFKGIPDPYWIAGFVSGDGSFNIKTTKTQVGKVQLRFAVTLHIRETDVVKGLADYFNKDKNKDISYTNKSVALQIVNTSNILNIIIPFFDKYAIRGTKELDYLDFKKVAEIVKSKGHITEEGYKEILRIKGNMNLNRK
jgi:hypothetical protein